jgi:CheY-like chemotaxis protein
MLPHLLTKASPAASQTDFVKTYGGTLAPWRLPAGVNRRVLFMDDDEDIRLLTAGMLAGLGYDYDLTVCGEEVLEYYRRQLALGKRYDAAIMDLTIKRGMGGAQTMVHLQKLDPDVCAIITSGYNSEEFGAQISEMGFRGILHKPYHAADLGKLLSAVLGG